jgi:hypothetical protein
MKRLLLLIAALSSACATEVTGEEIFDEGSVTLSNPDDEGKGDTVFGKTLRYAVRGEWTWFDEDGTLRTDTEVTSQTDTTVRVLALRIAVGIPQDELLRLSVDAESFNDLGDLSTDMAFLLFVPGPDQGWQPTQCAQSYFESAIIDPMNREIDVVTAVGSKRTYSFASCGIPDQVEKVAIFPFPSSNWGNMEGYYHLKVEADCGSRICPNP